MTWSNELNIDEINSRWERGLWRGRGLGSADNHGDLAGCRLLRKPTHRWWRLDDDGRVCLRARATNGPRGSTRPDFTCVTRRTGDVRCAGRPTRRDRHRGPPADRRLPAHRAPPALGFKGIKDAVCLTPLTKATPIVPGSSHRVSTRLKRSVEHTGSSPGRHHKENGWRRLIRSGNSSTRRIVPTCGKSRAGPGRRGVARASATVDEITVTA